MLAEIVARLMSPAEARTSVPQSEVSKWMEAEDGDTLGATFAFLSAAEHVDRVVPPLEFDPVFDFMLRYFEFCLRTNPQSEWAHSRYMAGTELVGMFVWMWDEGRDRRYFVEVKSRLAGLYVEGSSDVRRAIEHAVIEHLFEREPIREFFSDWRDDPRLRPAYDEGMLWVAGGGTSPLTERRMR